MQSSEQFGSPSSDASDDEEEDGGWLTHSNFALSNPPVSARNHSSDRRPLDASFDVSTCAIFLMLHIDTFLQDSFAPSDGTKGPFHVGGEDVRIFFSNRRHADSLINRTLTLLDLSLILPLQAEQTHLHFRHLLPKTMQLSSRLETLETSKVRMTVSLRPLLALGLWQVVRVPLTVGRQKAQVILKIPMNGTRKINGLLQRIHLEIRSAKLYV